VRRAALKIQALPQWQENASVQKLKFSDGWITLLLEKQRFRRKQITREEKNVPSANEILTQMKVGQDTYITIGRRGAHTVWNMDETALTYAIGPTHMYMPEGQQRADGSSDSKVRVTGIITVNGKGEFAPTMIIIKHKVSSLIKPDQRTQTVIQKMFKANDGFGARHGWELNCWESNGEIEITGLEGMHKHFVWYIRNTATGEVITSQVFLICSFRVFH
jgi:hypothetical protein